MQLSTSRIFRSIFLALLLSAPAYQASAQTNVVPDNVELAVLKKVYDSLGGSGWINKTNWPTPGNWPASVTSAEFDTWQGIAVNNGDITGIALNDNNLVGKLPRDIGKLKKLTSLYLPSNKITGRIPAAFGELINLTSLYLADNELRGSLPESLGNMSSLQTLYLSDNSLSGQIPSTFSALHELIYVYMHNNMLSGNLNALGNCSKIKSFNVGNNDFTGTIPSGCGSWTDLVNWSCYNNHFTGTLPAGIFSNRPSLTYVNVNDNELEGEFPSILGSPLLASLAAANNSFTALPAGLLSNTVLTVMDFRNNELKALPDFSAQENRLKLSVVLFDNRLDPAALEQTKNAGLKSARLTPQKNFRDVTMIAPSLGQLLVIPGRPVGTGTIAWEKLQSDGVTWTNVDTQNQDPDPASVKITFRRNAYAKATDEGIYRFKITNPQFQGIVFSSDPIRVQEQMTIVLDDWAFQYRYDGRRRMTHKKVPGAGWVFMVYDQRDRLVMTQDAEQRARNQWLFTKYDALNRPVMTGIYTHGSAISQEEMTGWIDTVNFYETYSATGNTAYHGYSNNVFPRGGSQILTVTYYDNYEFKAGWGIEYNYAAGQIKDQTVTGQQPYHQWGPMEFQSVVGQVTGTKVRTLETEPSWLQTVTYYDDHYRPVQIVSDNYKKGIDRITNIYDFVGKVLATKTDHVVGTLTWTNAAGVTITNDKLTKSAAGNGWNTAGASSAEYIPADTDGWIETTVADISSTRIFGLSASDPDKALATVNYGFYQAAGGMLNVQLNGTAGSLLGGNVVAIGDRLRIAREKGVIIFYKNGIKVYPTGSTSLPNTSALYADVAIYTSGGSISHARLSAAQGQGQIVDRQMVYDHAGRLLETWHRLNGGTNILLAKNEYNELGQLVDKKLHSTVSSGANAKQSVDYRYNIRGWLTSINNAALATDATNDDPNDLFGMNLAYNNTNLGIGADPQFNGNISAISYSKDGGKGDIKQTGYGFTYDPMNRMTNAAHQQRSSPSGTWSSGGFDEGGVEYDLNGNIRKLKRKGAGGVVIDDLAYAYETSYIASSNRLLSVEDKVANAEGFNDGNAGLKEDYTYDNNGNMTRDLNKGIGTSTNDAINVIAYNHLNLPQTVTKGGSTIRYVYDATGRKLAQYVASGASQKRTDYAGEFVYEDNVLQFLNHEEGRIVLASTKLAYTNSFDVVDPDNMTPVNVRLGEYEGKGEKYVVVTTSNTTPGNGVFPIGGVIENLDFNERYRVRVKAYAGTSPAYLQVQIKSGAGVVSTSTALIPNSSANEAWIELLVQTPSSGANLTLEAGVVWNTVTVSERICLNELEIIKLETTAPEYQYHMKDHLGNVRLTFTTKEDVETNKATMEVSMENDEYNQFSRYEDVRKIQLSLFDHTNDDNPVSADGRAIRLSGNENEKLGLAKTLSVMPGDVIDMSVYAKYIDPNTSGWRTAVQNLVSAVANANSGIVVDGSGYVTHGAASLPDILSRNTDNGTNLGPKAYMTYIMFDRDFHPIVDDLSQSGYVRLGDEAKENEETIEEDPINGVEHQELTASVTAKQAGYLYIYLSNEESSPVEVFFDDFEVVHTKGPVVQSEEYYPFGLTFNGYRRENLLTNQFQYNGKERLDELNLGWYDYQARQFDPAIGRFLSVDPAANLMRRISVYTYSFNNPIRFTDPDGMVPGDFLNEKGEKVGDDGKNDGKVYVIKTTQTEFDSGVESAGITKDEAKQTETFIKEYSGHGEAFPETSTVYRNTVEIEGSAQTRQGMVNTVNEDNGKGGTRDANNREYGGEISIRGEVTVAAPGAVANPQVDTEASVRTPSFGDDTRSDFHSHPSGSRSETTGGVSSTTMTATTTTTYSFGQAPSGHDVNNSGAGSNYVFGRGNGTVYLYNNAGVQATLPQRYFVNPKR